MAPFKFLGMSPRFSPAGDEVEDSRTPQTTSRPQSARQAEEVQNRNAAVPHRLRRALHQQPRRTRSADDEGQDEDLRRLPDPRGRADFRAPQVRRLDREKAALQHPAGPHRDPRAAHAIPRRLTGGRSHAARARRGGGFGGTERGRTERGDAAPSEPTRKRSPGRYRPAADADPEHLEPSQPRRSKPRRTPWAGDRPLPAHRHIGLPPPRPAWEILLDGAGNFFAHAGNFFAGAGNWARNRSARPDASNCVEGSRGRIRK